MNVISALKSTYALFGNWPPHTVELGTTSGYSEFNNITISDGNLLTKTVSTPYNIDVNFDENVLGAAAAANTFTSLTPPQSPPRNGLFSIIHQQHDSTPVQLHTLHYRPETTASTEVPDAPIEIQHSPAIAIVPHQNNSYAIPNAVIQLHPLNIGTASHYSDNAGANANAGVKDELEQAQLVDQIIEELAKDLPDMMSDEYESHHTYSPPSEMEESTTDEEWTPSNSANSSPGRYSSSSSSSCISEDTQSIDFETTPNTNNSSTGGVTKKRRPYGRGVEDRKIRKKEQNKNAATRYRQKKKLEMELVLGEEQKLAERNEELQEKLRKYMRETKYLKSLIREFYGKEFKKSST